MMDKAEKVIVGIDPGVNTGFGLIWGGVLREVKTYYIHQALDHVKRLNDFCDKNGHEFIVYIEDARKRKWFGTKGKEALQGVGSIKRDCKIWEDFCKYHEIECKLIAPKNVNTKLDAQTFKRITGWTHRCNEHARDAVMMIWGRR